MLSLSTLVSVFVLILNDFVEAQDNRAEDPNNHFIYPPLPGPQYSNDPTVFSTNTVSLTVGVLQSQPFKWQSNMTALTLRLQQEGNPEEVTQLIITECGTNAGFIYWDGDIANMDLDLSAVAYLAIWNCTEIGGDPIGTPVFFSHYLNLTEPATTSSSSSSSTTHIQTAASTNLATAVASTSSSSASKTESATASTSTTVTGASATSSSLNATTIGAGVGGGVGGAIILIAAAFACWKFCGKRRSRPAQISEWDHSHPAQQPPQPPSTSQIGDISPWSSRTTHMTGPLDHNANLMSSHYRMSQSPPPKSMYMTSNSKWDQHHSGAFPSLGSPPAEVASERDPVELPASLVRQPLE